MYPYLGPPELLALVRPDGEGFPLRSPADLDRWASHIPAADFAEPFTFTVGTVGILRLAPRRSEHVACAGGRPVLAAGELQLARASVGWSVAAVSNHSTGYCPDAACWSAVATALDRAGLAHPGGFTHEVVFRRWPSCGEMNIVREHHFVCVFCRHDLPLRSLLSRASATSGPSTRPAMSSQSDNPMAA